jgi:hypothetical protein
MAKGIFAERLSTKVGTARRAVARLRRERAVSDRLRLGNPPGSRDACGGASLPRISTGAAAPRALGCPLAQITLWRVMHEPETFAKVRPD